MNNNYCIDQFGNLSRYLGSESIVFIPKGVVHVGAYSFAMNSHITYVICPDSLKSIGDGAFERCVSLQRIDFGSNLLEIGEGAFFECRKLKKVSIPSSVCFINKWAFTSCTNLESISVCANNKSFSSIEGVLFNKDRTQLRIFPNSNHLKYVIPDSVIEIAPDAFFRCTSIESIFINERVTNLYFELFEGCSSLREIIVHPNNPDFSSICGALFSKDMKELIYLPGNTNLQLVIPPQTVSIMYGYSDCALMPSRISIKSNFNFIIIKNKYLVNIVNHTLVAICNPLITEYDLSVFEYAFVSGLFQYNSHIKKIILPKDMMSIPAWCFDSCYSLKLIYFPSNLIEIEDNAFRDCHALEKIVLPTSLTHIGDKAFLKCFNLKHLELPSNVESIGEYSFFCCERLEYVSLSNRISSIQKYSFAFCPLLQKIIIPDSVTYIDETAFYGSNLIIFVCSANSFALKYATQHCINSIII